MSKRKKNVRPYKETYNNVGDDIRYCILSDWGDIRFCRNPNLTLKETMDLMKTILFNDSYYRESRHEIPLIRKEIDEIKKDVQGKDINEYDSGIFDLEKSIHEIESNEMEKVRVFNEEELDYIEYYRDEKTGEYEFRKSKLTGGKFKGKEIFLTRRMTLMRGDYYQSMRDWYTGRIPEHSQHDKSWIERLLVDNYQFSSRELQKGLVSDIVERNNYNIEPNSVGRHGKVFNEREVS